MNTPKPASDVASLPKLTMMLSELPEWIERLIQDAEDPVFNYSKAEIAGALRNMLKVLAETPQDDALSSPAGEGGLDIAWLNRLLLRVSTETSDVELSSKCREQATILRARRLAATEQPGSAVQAAAVLWVQPGEIEAANHLLARGLADGAVQGCVQRREGEGMVPLFYTTSPPAPAVDPDLCIHGNHPVDGCAVCTVSEELVAAPSGVRVDEAEAFETWAHPRFLPNIEAFERIEGRPGGWEYNGNDVQVAWAAWQYRAALAGQEGSA